MTTETQALRAIWFLLIGLFCFGMGIVAARGSHLLTMLFVDAVGVWAMFLSLRNLPTK